MSPASIFASQVICYRKRLALLYHSRICPTRNSDFVLKSKTLRQFHECMAAKNRVRSQLEFISYFLCSMV
jgi:hypothetical protein